MATRRKFIQTTAGLVLVPAGISQLLQSCGGSQGGGDPGPTPSPTPTPMINNGVMTLPLTDYPALGDADGSVSFTVSGHGKVIICHLDAGTTAASWICVSQRCTHSGCSVDYEGSTNSFSCPCHGSQFASSGAVTQGPAMTPLHSFTTTFDGTSVVVDLNS